MVKRITYESFADIILNDDFEFSLACGLPEKYENEGLKFFATHDEKCVCAVRVVPEEAHIMHIESLLKGNGREMLEHIITTYFEEGERDVTLIAFGDEKLIDYYRTVGFEVTEEGSKMMRYVDD